MGIENETQRTSSKLDCKHNVLHKPILLKIWNPELKGNEKDERNKH